ncbi:hypothetical protein Tco_0550635 [Tanacetum coccineum]
MPRGGIGKINSTALVELVRSSHLSLRSLDRWNWNLESSGYLVASARSVSMRYAFRIWRKKLDGCGLVRDIANKVLSWWNLDHANLNSYAEWKSWLVSIRMDSKLKKMFEGVYGNWKSTYLEGWFTQMAKVEGGLAWLLAKHQGVEFTIERTLETTRLEQHPLFASEIPLQYLHLHFIS